ncbi:MAG: CAP domain-containing protein [Phycisphaerae bacterium]|nr:CAP domain-containing protein [Phycisphaerae bacterium]
MTSVRRSTIFTFTLLATIGIAGFGCGSIEEFPFLPSSVAGYVSPSSDTCYLPDDEAQLVDEVIRKVNEIRAENGVGPVTYNETLAAVAGDYGCTMIRDDYFGHYHPETGEGPGERASAHGYRYRAVGENLAAGQKTVEEVVQDWMESEDGHRENIINPMWTEIGVAVRTGGTYGIYWVQEFGAPWPALLP